MRLLAAFLLACAASLSSWGQASSPDSLAVAWEGPEPLRSQLRDLMPPPKPEGAERRSSFVRAWLRDVRRRAPEIAAAEGYFSAKVGTEYDDAADRVRIVVEPGPRTRVGSVDIDFAGDIAASGEWREARRKLLREAWALDPGAPFRSADWEDAKGRLRDLLTAERYPAGVIAESEARVDAAEASARLRLTVDSGPGYTLGELAISGLDHYPASIVHRANMLEPGEPYDAERLLQLQRSLQDGPWFASVVVDIARGTTNPERVPVQVSVVERPRHEVGLSLGFGTDHGVRGEVAYRYRNLFDRGWDLQSALRADRVRQIGYADVFLPRRILDTRWGDIPMQDSFGILAERTENQGLETRRLALAGYRHFTREPYELRTGLSFQIEEAMPSGARERLKRALAPVAAFTWRHVDDPFDPRRGGVLNVQLAAASKAVLSDQDFLKTYASYQRWFALSPRDQVIVRGEIGITYAPSREGIPEDFLFRAGGSRSVRGYGYQSLGPREGDAIVGGRYLATAGVDYVRWFNEQWGGAVFLDVGDAADTRGDWQPNKGYGVGARYKTPAGPLALDVAYGERDRKVRLVFSVTVGF